MSVTEGLWAEYYVAPNGDDGSPGTLTQPFASLARAQQAVRNKPGPSSCVAEHITCGSQLSLRRPIPERRTLLRLLRLTKGENPVISGGVRLEHLDWQPYTNGIFAAEVPEDLADRGNFCQRRAADPGALSELRSDARNISMASRPTLISTNALGALGRSGGWLFPRHAPRRLWGDFTWRITGKDAQGDVTKEGGWQNNRGGAVHREIRFVENIFEELDAPGEWFLNTKTHTLYFYPPAGLGFEKCDGGSHAAAEPCRVSRQPGASRCDLSRSAG